MSQAARVRELLMRWEQARRAAPHHPPLTAEELCEQDPELLPILQEQIRQLLKSDSNSETIADPDEARRRHPSAFTTPGGEEADTNLIPLPRVPGYEIIQEIGRGGMGVVYKARHIKLNRLVALKMILAGPHASGKARARFRIEAEAVARLQHPNIVQIFDMGDQDGSPFFALEFMNAANLDAVLNEGTVSPRQAARLLAPVARALHHAHQKHIVHRDLKPANILLQLPEGVNPTTRDERLQLVIPKLTDFGLAKELSNTARLTRTGVAIGTPSYMAPEQALAQTDRIGPATDIYGLGALLFELLNGRPPFDAPSDLEVLQAVVHAPPLFSKHPGDRDWQQIEAICLHCLAKNPDERYPSAAALADDLERLLENKAVSARATWFSHVLPRWVNAPFFYVLLITVAVAIDFALLMHDIPGFVSIPVAVLLLIVVLLQRRKGTPHNSGALRLPTPVPSPRGTPATPATHLRPPIRVGILHSLTGTMAVSETPVYEAVLLAIDELNRAGGLLGRQIEAVIADGHSDWAFFASEAERLIVREKVCTIFGCWTSASRRTVRPVLERHEHLLIYPLQYEGMERSPNILYLGAAPNQQILPAVEWAIKELNARRFYLIGSDYVFPHAAHVLIKDALQRLGGECVGEDYLVLGSIEVAAAIERIRAVHPDVILNSINGDSNLAFFRALRKAGFSPETIPTISFSLAEHEFRTLGVADMIGDYAAWSYFQSIQTPENRAFLQRLHEKFGPLRVATDPMETAYCAVHLWAQAVNQAGSDEVHAIRAAIKQQRFLGPGGIIEIDPVTLHARKVARIGRIRGDGQFEIVWSSAGPLDPIPYPADRSPAEWDSLVNELQKQWGGQWANPGT